MLHNFLNIRQLSEFQEMIVENVLKGGFGCFLNAHPLEPFPVYVPKNRRDAVRFFLIRLRWRIISPFVKYKSCINGYVLDYRAREK